MKIWSAYRPGVYVFEPTVLGKEDRLGRRERIEGLTIEFTTLGGPSVGSILDTAEFAERHGLDDAKREEIEQYLMSLPDWGLRMTFADESVVQSRQTGPGCPVMTQIQGGVRKCNRPVETDGELCEIHRPQFAKAQAPIELPAPPEAATV